MFPFCRLKFCCFKFVLTSLKFYAKFVNFCEILHENSVVFKQILVSAYPYKIDSFKAYPIYKNQIRLYMTIPTPFIIAH